MTYAELFTAVAAVLPKQSFSIKVESWRHPHFDSVTMTTEWVIAECHERSAARCTFYIGATAAAAFERLQADIAARTPTIAETSADVGDATIAESAP